MRDLGTLGGDYSAALDINEAGQVVGDYSPTPGAGRIRAFITDPNGMGMRGLGTLGGDYNSAWGINDAGQVVGGSDTSEGARHAFITDPDGEGMRDLGTLGGGLSFAWDINDAGQVVGISSLTAEGGNRAFITGPDGTGMIDLNSLVDLPQGVILTDALGINNNGQVIAMGVIPEPETYPLMLAGLGLIGCMARRKRAEVRI